MDAAPQPILRSQGAQAPHVSGMVGVAERPHDPELRAGVPHKQRRRAQECFLALAWLQHAEQADVRTRKGPHIVSRGRAIHESGINGIVDQAHAVRRRPQVQQHVP